MTDSTVTAPKPPLIGTIIATGTNYEIRINIIRNREFPWKEFDHLACFEMRKLLETMAKNCLETAEEYGFSRGVQYATGEICTVRVIISGPGPCKEGEVQYPNFAQFYCGEVNKKLKALLTPQRTLF